MARPRKPTKVLELQGSFKKDPQRRAARENEPQVTEPLGDPPDCLDEAERARWVEVLHMAPWVTCADRIVVEELCRLWMLSRRGAATPAHGKRLDWCVARLGMTPSDRSHVQAPSKPKEENPYSRFA